MLRIVSDTTEALSKFRYHNKNDDGDDELCMCPRMLKLKQKST